MAREINLIFGIFSIILGIWTLTLTGEYKFAFATAFMLMAVVFIRHYIEDKPVKEELPDISILGEKQVFSGETEIRVKIDIALSNLNVDAKIKSINVGPIITKVVFDTSLKEMKKLIRNKNALAQYLEYGNVEVNENMELTFLSPNKQLNYLSSCIDNKVNDKLELFVGKEDSGKNHIMNLKVHNSITITGNDNDSILNLMNSMIISLIMKQTSDNLGLVLIDNSGLNFSDYNSLPHLLFKTNENCLNDIVDELGLRLEKLGKSGHKNILEYNDVEKDKMKSIVIFINDLDYVIYKKEKEYLENIKTIMSFGKKVGIYLITSVNYAQEDAKNKLLDLCDTIITFGGKNVLNDVNLCNIYYPKNKVRVSVSYVSDKNIKDTINFYSK